MFSESEGYEEFMGRWSRRLAVPFVAFADVRDGERVLDVGSGTGALVEAVLATTNVDRVMGIDRSRTYVESARSRIAGDHAFFEEGDAQHLRFATAEFDKTLSLLVMSFIPDQTKALTEMARVTRPGGTVAAAVWDYGQGMEMLRVFWDEAVSLDASIESRDERHLPLCRSGEMAALWRQQGLADVTEKPLVIDLPFASFDDFWLPFLKGQGPAGSYATSLSEGHRQRLRDRLRARLANHSDASFTLNARAWAVKGMVPRSSR
jgi:SAM-dependent methyltransferase